MNDIVKYCFDCGKQCIKEKQDYYDTDTGEAVEKLICPDECEHGRHDFIPRERRPIFGKPSICKRCEELGHEDRYFD